MVSVQCPRCSEKFIVVAEDSPALTLRLDMLTTRQRSVFDVLYRNRPAAVALTTLERLLYDGICANSTVRSHIQRIRQKLDGTEWKIVSLDGAYALEGKH